MKRVGLMCVLVLGLTGCTTSEETESIKKDRDEVETIEVTTSPE